MKLKNRKVLVVGLGKTGVALAGFLVRRGAEVTVVDTAKPGALGDIPKMMHELKVAVELGPHRESTFLAADLIVVSPGVPHTIEPMRQAAAAGIEVIGEIELAYRFISAPILAVSGTNGKSTVTRLLGEMLTESGLKVFVGGNIGTPLISYVNSATEADAVVAEVSSFQLDTIIDFRPKIGILLNITDDHLDRYADFDAYAASKARLFRNQSEDDIAVLNIADAAIEKISLEIGSRRCLFNADETVSCGAWIEGTDIHIRIAQAGDTCIPCEGIPLAGRHNLENISAAALAALAAGGTREGILSALSVFRADPHRIEYVATINGVSYYDDSKATNVDAVIRAIEAVPHPVILIMGGRDKGGSYARLQEPIRRCARKLIVLGEAAEKIATALGGEVETISVGSMTEAVDAAAKGALPGDSVLLSPACSSFDMYQSYAARGDDFQHAVNTLTERNV